MKRYDLKITHWGTITQRGKTIAAPVVDTITGVPETEFKVSPEGVDINFGPGYSKHYYNPIKLELKESK